MDIPLPDQFNDLGAVHFAVFLQGWLHEPEITLDFRTVQFAYPYGTLVIAHAIKHFATKRRGIGLRTTARLDGAGSQSAISYLRYFGFFRYINVAGEQEREDAPGGARYLPVRILNISSLTPREGGGAFQDTVELTSNQLAKVIVPAAADPSVVDMLSYCFRELIRNSFEHAQVATCAVMAQRWDNGIAEVAIADRGIGVYRALSQAHRFSTPDDAVLNCLKPGISSGSHIQTGSQWDNTGFGLYVVSQLGRRYGSFSMLSAERFLNPAQGVQPLRQVPLPGTLVKLRVRTRDFQHWPDVLREIVSRGEEEARLMPGAVTEASAASKKSNTWEN